MFRLKKNGDWFECDENLENNKDKIIPKAAVTCCEFIKHVKSDKCIGAGTYGQIWTLIHNGKPLQYVMKISSFTKYNSTIEEVKVLSINKCKFFPKLKYSGYSEDLKNWCIIMEYFDGRDLDFYFEDANVAEYERLNQSEGGKEFIAYELAEALEYLHIELKRTHSDLKPDNIRLTSRGHVRLFDFGHSRRIDAKTGKLISAITGKIISDSEDSPHPIFTHRAPEVWNGEDNGFASDRWSYGCIIAQLYQKGNLAFYGLSKDEKEERKETEIMIFNGNPDLKMVKDTNAKEFILELLKKHPKERVPVITKHKFFDQKNHKKEPSFVPMPYTPVQIQNVKNLVHCNYTKYQQALIKNALKLPCDAYMFFSLPPDVERNITLTNDMKKYCNEMESVISSAFAPFKTGGLTKFEKFATRLDKIAVKKKIKKVGSACTATVSLLNELAKRDRQITADVLSTFCIGFCKQFLQTEIKYLVSTVDTLKKRRLDKDACNNNAGAEEADAAFNAALNDAQTAFANYPQYQKNHAGEVKKLLVIMSNGIIGKVEVCDPCKKALSL